VKVRFLQIVDLAHSSLRTLFKRQQQIWIRTGSDKQASELQLKNTNHHQNKFSYLKMNWCSLCLSVCNH
jgi:hypothetical protein